MQKRDVLVIGAGIGGLTAALALQRSGIKVTVCEQASELFEIGAGIMVSPNGMHALNDLGLGSRLAGMSDAASGSVVRNYKTGEFMLERPDSAFFEEKYGAACYQVHRHDLHALLCEAVLANDPEAIKVDHTFADLRQDEDGVTARFANGKELAAAALIGCDGGSSTVRPTLTGSEGVNYTGQVAFRALVPMEVIDPASVERQSSLYIGPGRLFLHYSLRQGTLLNIVAIAREPEWQAEGWSIPATAEEFLELCSDFHPNVQGIIRAIPKGMIFKWGLRDREPMPQWTFGRVTMLGDAAHPMSPFLGQGAVMAIEDALVLGRSFAAADSIGEALCRYEAARRPRANGVQLQSREQAGNYQGTQAKGFNVGRNPEDRGLFDYNPATVEI